MIPTRMRFLATLVGGRLQHPGGSVVDVIKKTRLALESNGHAVQGGEMADHHGADRKSRDNGVGNMTKFQQCAWTIL